MCLTPRCDAASNFDNVIAHLDKINKNCEETLYQTFQDDWDWEELRFTMHVPTPEWLSGLGEEATRNHPLNTAGGTIGLDRSGGGGTYIGEDGEIAGANFQRERLFY